MKGQATTASVSWQVCDDLASLSDETVERSLCLWGMSNPFVGRVRLTSSVVLLDLNG